VIYEVLTWLIIRLGKLRDWWCLKIYWDSVVERYDRAEANRILRGQVHLRYGGFGFECCDCGLKHLLKTYGDDGPDDLQCIPYRPEEYE